MHSTRASVARHPRLRTALAVVALSAGALLAGCGGDEDPPTDASTEGSTEAATDDPTTPPATPSPPADDDPAAAMVQTGLELLAAGDTETARAAFEGALTLDPTNAYALYNLGQMAQSDGDDEQALDYYDRALRAKADLVPALYNTSILLETTDLQKSVLLYRQVLKIDDEHAPAHMRLGFALVHLGDIAEAERHLTRGLELDPSMADISAPDYG